jgi:hypothetical protein
MELAQPIVEQLVTRVIDQLGALETYHATRPSSSAPSSAHGESKRLFSPLLGGSIDTSSITPSHWPHAAPPLCVATHHIKCINDDILDIFQPLVHQQHVHG